MNMLINKKSVLLNNKDSKRHLEYINIKDDLILHKYLCSNRNYQKSLMKTSTRGLLIHANFISMISIPLFCCCKKVFIHTNLWMIWKNSRKHRYQRKMFTPKHGSKYH